MTWPLGRCVWEGNVGHHAKRQIIEGKDTGSGEDAFAPEPASIATRPAVLPGTGLSRYAA